MATGARLDNIQTPEMGCNVKRCISPSAYCVDFRPGCQKSLEASRLVDAENASDAHLNDLCVSLFGGNEKRCVFFPVSNIDSRAGRH